MWDGGIGVLRPIIDRLDMKHHKTIFTIACHNMLQPYPKPSVRSDPFVSDRPKPGTWLPEDSMIRFLVASKIENIAAIKNRSSDSI